MSPTIIQNITLINVPVNMTKLGEDTLQPLVDQIFYELALKALPKGLRDRGNEAQNIADEMGDSIHAMRYEDTASLWLAMFGENMELDAKQSKAFWELAQNPYGDDGDDLQKELARSLVPLVNIERMVASPAYELFITKMMNLHDKSAQSPGFLVGCFAFEAGFGQSVLEEIVDHSFDDACAGYAHQMLMSLKA